MRVGGSIGDGGWKHGRALQVRTRLASVALELAALRLRSIFRKTGFNPNQPRVPAGNPDGGQWTDTGGGGAIWTTPAPSTRPAPPQPPLRVAQVAVRRTQVTVRAGGRRFSASQSQATRLTLSQVHRDGIVEQVHQRDPEWRARPQTFQTVEGAISANNAVIREAQTRLRELERARIGHNQGPPLGANPRTGTSTPSRLPFDGARINSAFRATVGMPPIKDGLARSKSDGTVALSRIDRSIIIGVNSSSPAYTRADEAAAQNMRAKLVTRYPDVMATKNLGHRPNNALFHAETTALLRAANANGGSLSGRSITISIDRSLCRSCRRVLPYVSRQLGRPTVRIIEPNGTEHVLRGGRWVRRKKK